MQKENLSSLVAKAQAGDNQALNDLFTETYNDVYYFALKTIKDETLAADVTQETFVTVFQNISTLNDPVAYPAWSRQITYRHCLQHLKKQNREATVDENEDGSTIFDIIEEDRTEFIPEENLDKEDFKKTILQMVDSLPEEQRTAVILYYYDELSIKEIAEIQGVTEGTVKSRLNYARKAIKASVESYEKKHNVKLRCAGVLPLLLWLFASDFGASAIGDEEPTYINGSQNTESSIGNTFEIGTKNGLIQRAVFSVVFALDEEKKEWYVSKYNYREENTYELPQDTTWTGSNGGNSYTVTLAKGFLYDTTGHITIKGSDGEVLLDSDIVCKKVSDKENKYFFTTEVDLGWWNYDLSMIYSEEDGSFTFYNCYEGTIYLQN